MLLTLTGLAIAVASPASPPRPPPSKQLSSPNRFLSLDLQGRLSKCAKNINCASGGQTMSLGSSKNSNLFVCSDGLTVLGLVLPAGLEQPQHLAQFYLLKAYSLLKSWDPEWVKKWEEKKVTTASEAVLTSSRSAAEAGRGSRCPCHRGPSYGVALSDHAWHFCNHAWVERTSYSFKSSLDNVLSLLSHLLHLLHLTSSRDHDKSLAICRRMGRRIVKKSAKILATAFKMESQASNQGLHGLACVLWLSSLASNQPDMGSGGLNRCFLATAVYQVVIVACHHHLARPQDLLEVVEDISAKLEAVSETRSSQRTLHASLCLLQQKLLATSRGRRHGLGASNKGASILCATRQWFSCFLFFPCTQTHTLS